MRTWRYTFFTGDRFDLAVVETVPDGNPGRLGNGHTSVAFHQVFTNQPPISRTETTIKLNRAGESLSFDDNLVGPVFGGSGLFQLRAVT